MMEHTQKMVEYWDENIRKSIENESIFLDDELKVLFRSYKETNKKTRVWKKFMPEPYVGNPLVEDPFAVMISINPGKGGESQCMPNGEVVKRVLKNNSYYKTASNWKLHKDTKKWWENRIKWPDQLINNTDSTQIDKFVAFDIFPWHSKKYGGLSNHDNIKNTILKNVFLPAQEIASRSKLSKKFGLDGNALVLAIGAPTRKFCNSLDFREKTVSITRTTKTKPSWIFNKLTDDKIKLTIFQAQSCSVHPPSDAFSSLSIDILRDQVKEEKVKIADNEYIVEIKNNTES